MELLLFMLVGGALYLYHDSVSGSGSGGGVNVTVNNGPGSSTKPKQQKQDQNKPGFGGFGGGGGGREGGNFLGGGGQNSASGQPWSFADIAAERDFAGSDLNEVIDRAERQDEARASDWESNYAANHFDYGPPAPTGMGGDMPFSDDLDPEVGAPDIENDSGDLPFSDEGDDYDGWVDEP